MSRLLVNQVIVFSLLPIGVLIWTVGLYATRVGVLQPYLLRRQQREDTITLPTQGNATDTI